MKRFMLVFWRFSKADLRVLRAVWSHPERPGWLRPATILLLLYALAPFNFVLPVLGVVDDLVLVPLAFHFLMTLVPAHLHGAMRPTRMRP